MWRWWAVSLLVGCAEAPGPAIDGESDAYLHDRAHRREVFERDLVSVDNDYAQLRLDAYARDEGWDALPERDPASHGLASDTTEIAFDSGAAATLLPEALPETDEAWIELGRRVWHEYPFASSRALHGAAEDGRLSQLGFQTWEGEVVGLRVLEGDGEATVGPTCAMCHSTIDAGGEDGPSAVRSNRDLDVGGIRLHALQGEDDTLLEIDTSTVAQLELLARGHSDPLDDGRFNPYAFPDLGGIADLPLLHHTANWHNASITTLAIRIETVFITAAARKARIPRALAWAAAMYLRSLPPPPPSDPTTEAEAAPGRAVFEAEGCAACHVPPLYASERLVTLEEVGTDPGAGQSKARGTGYYRIPSLRGVGGAAPYLHDGSVATLEALFDPEREAPGHAFGLELSDDDRAALLVFLRGL